MTLRVLRSSNWRHCRQTVGASVKITQSGLAFYQPRQGRPGENPRAFGVCDRCGLWYNLEELQWQFDWRGPKLQNLRIRVCRPCTDKPFEFYRPVILPPEPVSVPNPRPENFAADDGPPPTQIYPPTPTP